MFASVLPSHWVWGRWPTWRRFPSDRSSVLFRQKWVRHLLGRLNDCGSNCTNPSR